ncbi:MAG: spermidine synthase [Pseudomonadota bacterium]|jgi:spermidine synthase
MTDQRQISFGMVGTLYLFSGALGLIYEVTFSKYLGLSFGATAAASSAVLVAFMGGLALGAYFTGKFERRVTRPLYLYGLVELAIGFFCLLAPLLFELLTPLYMLIAGRTQSLAVLSAARGAVAIVIVAVPAVGMGSTLPLLARFVHAMFKDDPRARDHGAKANQKLAALYGINTLGGALGSLGCAYLVLPNLGLSLTLRCCAAVSLSIGLLSLWLGRNYRAPAPDAAEAAAEAAADAAGTSTLPALSPRAAYLLAGMSGLLVFSCEVVAVHLLALVIGTSVYAFGLMLFIFLVCLSLGTPLARWLEQRLPNGALPVSLGLTGLALLLSLPIWDQLPRLFVALGPTVRGWHGRELVRGLAAFTALCVPVTLMGTTFPLILRAARGAHVVRDIGRITSCNTIGSILGSLLAGFVVLERLGSQKSLTLVALGYLVGSLVADRRKVIVGAAARLRPSYVLAGVGVLLAVLLPPWNLQRLTSGTNVYFDIGVVENGILESIHEDVHGGVTTVVRNPVTSERTLLTNGKFQGNDSREVAQNKGLGYLPTFFAEHTDRALLIGMGTAVTAAALAEFPYQRIDIAELAPAIVDAARTTFAEVNAHVLEDPRAHVLKEDGRNVLAINDAEYDVITVEVSSIWFAGAANLYNREFYEIAKTRLSHGGILQQWIAFHHTNRQIVTTILATIRESFPHVALLVDGHQGHILASLEPLKARLSRIEEFADAHGLDDDQLLTYVRGAALDTKAIDAFASDTAEQYDQPLSSFISTDDNLALEYITPKGNVPTADHIPTTLGYLYEYKPAGIVQAHVRL